MIVSPQTTEQISLVFSGGEPNAPESILSRIKNLKRFFLFFKVAYVWLWKTLLRKCFSASWGPSAAWLGPREKCCFWERLPLIVLWIRNKILVTQLYSAHEVDFMFTKKACNLWIKSYFLILKIKLSSENPTWRKEDAKIKNWYVWASCIWMQWVLLLSCCV